MKGELALREVDRRIVNRYLTAGKASKQQFHIKWQEVVDEMILFKPNLVIISAGFDAHSADQLGNCYLDDEDFEWATDIIVTACASINSSDPPPILSVLEGGYDLEAIAASASAHVKALSRGTVSPTTKRDDSVDAIEQSVMSLRIS
jgi:acetoin utilization deacetylase AcuC-like enzyme